jgi:hypothetical protein
VAGRDIFKIPSVSRASNIIEAPKIFPRKEAMTSWLELLFTVIAFGGFIVIATIYKPGVSAAEAGNSADSESREV